MTCETYGSLTISYGPRTERIKNEVDGDARWCFRCRKVREFRFTIDAPVEVSYYGPNASIRCGTCGLDDGDLFPGRYRVWEED